jgi:hypothetical protein
MNQPEDPKRQAREARAAQVKEKEGTGTVPNANPAETQGKAGEIKKAMHDLEEQKGDWAMDH